MEKTVRVSKSILNSIRETLGLEQNDTSQDNIINEMSNYGCMARLFYQHNISGCTTTLIKNWFIIKSWIEEIYFNCNSLEDIQKMVNISADQIDI